MIPELAEFAIPTSGISPRSASGDGSQDDGEVTAEASGSDGVSEEAETTAVPTVAFARGDDAGETLLVAGTFLAGAWTTTVGKVTADCAFAIVDDPITAKVAKIE